MLDGQQIKLYTCLRPEKNLSLKGRFFFAKKFTPFRKMAIGAKWIANFTKFKLVEKGDLI